MKTATLLIITATLIDYADECFDLIKAIALPDDLGQIA